jgi:hypothetical protein
VAAAAQHIDARHQQQLSDQSEASEVCTLRWEYEVTVPDLETSIFVIPVKNGDDRVVVLNRVAKSVVESLRDYIQRRCSLEWTGRRENPNPHEDVQHGLEVGAGTRRESVGNA